LDTVVKMIDSVNAGDRVEAVFPERQRPIGVRTVKLSAVGESAFGRQRSRRPNAIFFHIDANNRASAFCGYSQSWAAGAAGYIKQSLPRGELEPRDEPILFISCKPTVLPDVFAESFPPDLSVKIALEIPIVRAVVTRRRGWEVIFQVYLPLGQIGTTVQLHWPVP
jgi:hypothetical protein